ncbi:MAG: trypsin-like peptidase domain-containing protein [Candidatus Aphodosoma sp.]
MGYAPNLIFPNEARDNLARKAVRTSIIDPNAAPVADGENGGSGILVASRRKHYVLTACHCIKDADKEAILVQWKDSDGIFHKIAVKCVLSKDEKEDWAILEVESPRNGIRYDNIKLGGNEIIYKDPQFVFFGFPGFERNGRPFEIEYKCQNHWTVKEFFDYSMENFAQQVEGCSGSGVVAYIDEKVYCVAILKEVSGKTGKFQDVFSTSAIHLANALAAQGEDKFKIKQEKAPAHIIPDEAENYIERFCSVNKLTHNLWGWENEMAETFPLIEFVKGNVTGCNSYHYLLCGSAHSGKSYELKHLAHVLGEEGYEVKLLKTKDYKDIETLELPEEDEENGRQIAILIDALDETSNGDYEQLAECIAGYARNHEDTVVVVSCRDGYVGDEQMKGFTRLYLHDLTHEQVDAIIANEAKNSKLLFEQIRDNHLADEVRLPFFLRFVIERHNKGISLPSNNAMLYKDWVSLSYQQQREKYPGDVFEEATLMESLIRMALVLQLTGKMQLAKEELVKIVGEEGAERIIKNDLITDGAEYGFKYNSIKEYLIARSLRTKSLAEVKGRVCFRDRKEINPVWRNVLMLWLQLVCSEEGRLSQDVVDWIMTTDRTLLVACDSRALDDDTRLSVFRSIMEDMRDRKQFISIINNDFYSRLYHFAECEKTDEYIIGQIENETEASHHLYNMMTMMMYVDWDGLKKRNERLYARFNAELFAKLDKFGHNENDCGSSYFLLHKHFYTNHDCVSRVMDMFADDEEAHVKERMLSLVARSGMTDEYIDYVLWCGAALHTRDTSNYLQQTVHYKALMGAKSVGVILKALRYICSPDVVSAIHKQDEYLEMIRTLLENLMNEKTPENSMEVYDVLVSSFRERFEKLLFFVDQRVREELDLYRSAISCYGEWTEPLNEIYLRLYTQGQITPKEEQRRKAQRQQDFDDFCNYETFRTQAHELVTNYVKNGGKDWTAFGLTKDGHFNIYMNRYYAEIFGLREIVEECARKHIEDKDGYDYFRLIQCAEILFGHRDKLDIKPEVEVGLLETARRVLKTILEGKQYKDDRIRQAAIQFLISGKVTLADDDLVKLLKYSHECISGEMDMISWDDDKRSLLMLMEEQMGVDKLSTYLREAVKDYDGYVTLYVYQWLHYLVAKDKKESKGLLLERFLNTKSPDLRGKILELLLEYDIATSELSDQLRNMNDSDLLTCCDKLSRVEGYQKQVCSLLEERMPEMNAFHRKQSIKILLSLGSIYALKYVAEHAEEVMKNGDFWQFSYSSIEALPYLSSIFPFARNREFEVPAAMSILNSMGEIAASSDENYEVVCKELDKLSSSGDQFIDVAQYKQNFKNRLLQRKEKEMTLDEALNAI